MFDSVKDRRRFQDISFLVWVFGRKTIGECGRDFKGGDVGEREET
jgi:hypothetical protein